MLGMLTCPWHYPLNSECPCCPQILLYTHEEARTCPLESHRPLIPLRTDEEESIRPLEPYSSPSSSQKSLFCFSSSPRLHTSESYASWTASVGSNSVFDFEESESDSSSSIHSTEEISSGPNIYEMYTHGWFNTPMYTGGMLYPPLSTLNSGQPQKTQDHPQTPHLQPSESHQDASLAISSPSSSDRDIGDVQLPPQYEIPDQESPSTPSSPSSSDQDAGGVELN